MVLFCLFVVLFVCCFVVVVQAPCFKMLDGQIFKLVERSVMNWEHPRQSRSLLLVLNLSLFYFYLNLRDSISTIKGKAAESLLYVYR